MSKSTRTYMQIKNELDVVFDNLQNVDTDVDKAIELHKAGTKLIMELENYLKNSENLIKSMNKK